MKVMPVSSPHAVQPTTNNTAKAADARSKAIAAFSGQQDSPQPQEVHPVNANNVTPEDLSALTPPSIPKPAINTISEDTVTQEASPEAPAIRQDDELKANFDKLARQERAFRQQVQRQKEELQRLQDAVKAKDVELSAKEDQYRKNYISREVLQRDALGTLESEGLATYDDITQRAITRQPTDPLVMRTITTLQDQVKQLETKLQQAQDNQTRSQQDSVQAAMKQIEIDVTKLVRNNPDFELIDKQNRVKSVVKLIKDTYDNNGEVLDAEEAAQLYEQELLDRALNSYKNISKIQKRVSEASANASVPQKTQTLTQQPQMKTLTNAASASRKLSAKERAILAFKGELKG